MKKFLAITLVLIFVFSFGVSAFAVDDVKGTLADGTEISKAVSEVHKTVEDGIAELKEIDAERAEKLQAFFASWEENEDVEIIAKGIVHFAGFFADVTEDELDVDLPVPGAKADEKYLVILSNDTQEVGESKEDGAVTAAFPKDSDYMGYVIVAAEIHEDGTTIIRDSDTTSASPQA